jgi:hypothetical protein
VSSPPLLTTCRVPRTNFQKLPIGANSGVGSRRILGRVLRILYNPIFSPDVLGLRQAFIRLARFRNGLYGLPRDHAASRAKATFPAGCRQTTLRPAADHPPGVVSRIFASWNQLDGWLRQVEGLRRVA